MLPPRLRDTPARVASRAPNRGPSARSRRVPREPLDARDDLPEQRPCQVAFGELQGEVPSMSDQASAGLEEPLLEARQRPVLDGQRQGQPTRWYIALASASARRMTARASRLTAVS
jgi:hypothetical protein